MKQGWSLSSDFIVAAWRAKLETIQWHVLKGLEEAGFDATQDDVNIQVGQAVDRHNGFTVSITCKVKGKS